MQYGRKFYYWLVLTVFILSLTGFLFYVWTVRRTYDEPRLLKITGIDGKAIYLDVPLIKRHQGYAGTFERFYVSDQDGKNYVLNWNRKERTIYFAISRGEFCGWILMSGYYDIDSQACHTLLCKFLQQNFSHQTP